MIPMLPFSPPPSVVNAYAQVDKATSEFLNCPDWRINIGICDTINSRPWLAKDFIKAVRTKLQHKNPNVQLLALTLLETIMKNCSEHVHSQIAERKILQEMIKIVKKKVHMRVREKILVLIDTWQEAFSHRGGKITAQYYRAYEELRRCRVEFPYRSPNTIPVITPPVNYGHHQAGTSSSTSHESDENVSLSNLESMRDVLDLLSEMLQAVDPKDCKAVKDEVITDLYDQCRSNQKKLGYTLSSTTDEEILRQRIQLNDALQYVIEKHDAIATGSLVPAQSSSLMTQRSLVKQRKEVNQKPIVASYARVASSSSNEILELLKEQASNSTPINSRCSETQTVVTHNHHEGVSASKTDKKVESDPSLDMALVPSGPPPPANKKTPEEGMIDLLTLALSPASPSKSNSCQPNVQPPMNNYVVPWAQTQPQLQHQQSQIIQHQSNYIPPPWPPTPGYYCNSYGPNHSPSSNYNNGSGNGAASNQYVPSYRLFEDLNVLGNLRNNGTPGTSGSSMLGARK